MLEIYNGQNLLFQLKKGNVVYQIQDLTLAQWIDSVLLGTGENSLSKTLEDAKSYVKSELETAKTENSKTFATKQEVENAKKEAINKVNELAGTNWTEAGQTVMDILNELKGTDVADSMVTLVDKLKGIKENTVVEYVQNEISKINYDDFATHDELEKESERIIKEAKEYADKLNTETKKYIDEKIQELEKRMYEIMFDDSTLVISQNS